MLGSTSAAENSPVPGGASSSAVPPGAAYLSSRGGAQVSFAQQLSTARASAALDEHDPRRRTRADLAALAVQELSSRTDHSPSAAVKTADAVRAEDQAGESAPRFTAEGRDRGGAGARRTGPSRPDPRGAGGGVPDSPRPAAAPASTPSSPADAPVANATPAPSQPRAVAAEPLEGVAVSAAAVPAAQAPQASAAPSPPGGPAAAPVSKASDSGPRTTAARRPAPPPRPFQLEEAGFAQHVSRAMAAALRQRGGTVTMRLAPESLGQVRVALTLDGGRVDASFEASTEQARRLLHENLTALRAALEAHGLTVDRLGVAPTEGPRHHDPGTGSLTEDSGGGRHQPASEHAGNHRQAGGTDARGLTQGDDPAEPTRQGAPVTGGARTIRLRLDAVA